MRHRQRGVTFLGFLILAAAFGALIYGGLRVTPLYLEQMTLTSVLEDVKKELDGQGPSVGSIRNAIDRRLIVEGTGEVKARDFKIEPTGNGYRVSLDHVGEARYIANLWLVVKFDKAVEIRR
jgi:hypothetical protein